MVRSTNQERSENPRLAFAHNRKQEGGFESVCLNCSETIGSSDQEWDLAGCEFIHSLECWKKKPKSTQRIV
jgi:hypothetical protein